MILAILGLTLMGFCGIILLGYGLFKENTFCSALGGAIIGIVVVTVLFVKEPTALDVYRGKTTLKITYEDSVPIDSIVVYKK